MLSKFEEHVKTLYKPGTQSEQLCHSAMGMAGEAGEVVDLIKKGLFYGKPLDGIFLVEECGDVLFYVTAMLQTLGVTLEQCMGYNIEKLQKRYPEGYSDEAAIARVDVPQEADTKETNDDTPT